jgi:type I restriction enzyme M protein
LIDARDIWTPGGSEESKRSLGDKRRHMTAEQIRDVVRIYGQFPSNGLSKTFDNEDFGYSRVTIERPLRLRYQMTVEKKARFLDACPNLLDDVQSIDKMLGRESSTDWNVVWNEIDNLLHERRSRWKAPEKKLFRTVFCDRDPSAEPVVLEGRQDRVEPDPDLRDFENIPLKEDIAAYFDREVKPHVPDAWMDRSKDKIGYEINFNRYFYRYQPPRALEEIDADLKQAEEDIVRLLAEVTS